jgi:chaperonin GroEL
VTLGPAGRNVMIERPFGDPAVTKDGVSVAREILLSDRLQNMGAQFVRNAASKTNERAGDGTTTATVLTQALYEHGLKAVKGGKNPVTVSRGIIKASEAVIQELKKYTKVIEDSGQELIQIANISSNSDKAIGKMIGEAYSKVGKEGVISVEQSTNLETYVELAEGMKFGSGYFHPYFVNEKKKGEVKLSDVIILITEDPISKFNNHLTKLMDMSVGEGKSLLIIGEVEGQALETLLVNKLENNMKISICKGPGFGDRKKEYLEDIAYVTGGKVLSKVKGKTMANFSKADLGHCDSITSDFHDTILSGGFGTKDMINFRVEELEAQKEHAENDYETKQFEKRIASLRGGVGVIYVGAASEVEVKEKMDRIEDAKNATRAALEEGIVCGGGIALLQARKTLDLTPFEGDESVGATIIFDALSAPITAIVENAGDSSSLIIESLNDVNHVNAGYDAREGVFVTDMIEAGIIDPVKVTRIALENAASAAAMLLTTECTITTKMEGTPSPQNNNMPMF